MKNNKKIKIHVKNNHWAPGSFLTDAEGEKNFTITKEHLDEALKNFPEIKEKVEIFVDWDEDNFKTSILNSDIFSQSFLVFNSQSSNMMICTINVLIACTICYTRLLSSLLLGHPLLCFYTLLIWVQFFEEIHISFLSVLTQFPNDKG